MTDYGPQLPPGLRRPAPANDEDTAATAGAVGPQLPPESSRPAVAQEDSNTFGPALPPELAAQRGGRESASSSSAAPRAAIGPSLPPWLQRKDLAARAADADDEVVGPLPPPAGASSGDDDRRERERVVREFEERASGFKSALTHADSSDGEAKATSRGEWMLKPPEYDIGAGDPLRSRGFSQKDAKKHDSSAWTETPADRARKAEEARKRFEAGDREADKAAKRRKDEPPAGPSRADVRTRKEVEEYNKQHRPKSLMAEYHEKYLPSKLATAEDVASRPFDREKDLAVRRIDPNKRQQFIQQAGNLSSRFSRGSGSTYL